MALHIEQKFARLFILSGDILILFYEAMREISAVKSAPGRVVSLMFEIGYRTLLLVSMIGLFEGMIIALQTGVELKEIGLSYLTGSIVGLSMVREMGPVITAVIVTGRVGSAMAAEIGTMSVSEEIDALRVMGISPVRYIVTPRIVACILVLPVLTIYSIVIGIWGGSLVSSANLGVTAQVYYDQVWGSMEMIDIVRGISKTFVFGAIFSTVCCYMGMTARDGAMGVGRNTTRAVVVSLTMILVSDFFMTRFI